MSIQKSYDVIIAGGQLSGLLAAALLNNQGVHVLVLDDEDCQEKIIKGHKLDLQMFHSSKLSESSGVRDILSILGIDLSDTELFYPSQPFFQVITEGHRLGFHGSWENITDEFEREFPEEAQSTLSLLRSGVESREKLIHALHNKKRVLPSHGMKGKLDDTIRGKKRNINTLGDFFQDKVEKGGFSASLKNILSLCLDYAIPLFPGFLKTNCFPLHLGNPRGCVPRGGMTALKSLIKGKLKDAGVSVYPLSGIDKLTIQKKKVLGITTYGSYETIHTKALIYNTGLSILSQLLPKSLFTKAFRETLESNKRWGRWRSVFIIVDKNKVPVGMHDDVVIDRGSSSPLILQIQPPGYEKQAQDGTRLLKVSTRVEDSKDIKSANPESADAFEQSVIETLRKLMPFLDERFEIIYRFDREPLSKDDYIFKGPIKGPLNVGIISPFTPYGNLFISGKEVITTLGLEGDFILARVLANHISNLISGKEN